MPPESPNPFTPPRDDATGPTPKAKSGEAEPYELAPDDDVPVAKPVPKSDSPALVPPASGSVPSPKFNAVNLLDDFDEDADFSKDPEVERALKDAKAGGTAVRRESGLGAAKNKSDGEGTPGAESADARAFVRPGKVEAKVWAAFGGGLVLAAAISAAVVADENKFPAAVAAVYLTCFHAATGVLAMGATAQLAGRPFGKFDFAGARMLVAAGLFSVFFHIHTPVPGRWDELMMALGGYWLALTFLFQNGPRATFIVAALHGIIWGATALAQAVASWAAVSHAAQP